MMLPPGEQNGLNPAVAHDQSITASFLFTAAMSQNVALLSLATFCQFCPNFISEKVVSCI